MRCRSVVSAVLALVWASVPAIASAEPTPIDETVAQVGPIEAQHRASAAHAGSGKFLVVWQDDVRNAVYGRFAESKAGTLSAQGATFLIAEDAIGPGVAFGDGSYLVTWQRSFEDEPHVLHGTLVSPEGVVGNPQPLVADTNANVAPQTIYHGSGFASIWTLDGTLWRTTFVLDKGTAKNITDCAMASANDNPSMPRLATRDSRTFAAWSRDSNGVKGISIAEMLASQGCKTLCADLGSAFEDWSNPAIAVGVDDLLLAWSSNTGEVQARSFDRNDCTLPPSNVETLASGASLPSVTFDPGESAFAVMYNQAGALKATLIQPKTPPGLVFPLSTVAASPQAPTVVAGQADHLLVWPGGVQGSGTDTDVYAGRLSIKQLYFTDEQILGTRGSRQHEPAAIAGPNGDYLVAWIDYRAGKGQLFVRVVGSAPSATTKLSSKRASSPAVAYDAGSKRYLVVWKQTATGASGLRGRLLEQDGTPVGTTTKLTTGSDSQAAVVSHETNSYRIAWRRQAPIGIHFGTITSPEKDKLELKNLGRVSHEQMVGNPQKVGVYRNPTLVREGDKYVVAFQHHNDLTPHFAALLVVRVDSDKDVPEIPPAAILIDDTAQISQPRLLNFNGAAIALWSSDSTVYAAVVDQPKPPRIHIGSGTTPAMVDPQDDYNLFVSWLSPGGSVMTRRVTHDGAALATPFSAQELAAGEGHQSPVVASEGKGNVLVAYAREDAAPEHALRVYYELVKSGQLDGAPCSGAHDECANGHCLDGVCCKADKAKGCATCQRCQEGTGECAPVTNGSDVGTCEAPKTCDFEGNCKDDDGQKCTSYDTCASGHCVAGLCCNTACDGACDTCVDVGNEGSCITVTCTDNLACKKDEGVVSCGLCVSSFECPNGSQCYVDGSCRPARAAASPAVSCQCELGAAPSRRPLALFWLALLLAMNRRRKSQLRTLGQ